MRAAPILTEADNFLISSSPAFYRERCWQLVSCKTLIRNTASVDMLMETRDSVPRTSASIKPDDFYLALAGALWGTQNPLHQRRRLNITTDDLKTNTGLNHNLHTACDKGAVKTSEYNCVPMLSGFLTNLCLCPSVHVLP